MPHREVRPARVVGLGGGIGASRLWRALVEAEPSLALTVVVNTADDLWAYGLRVSPDIDTTLYSLSDRHDLQRGWGVRDESWRTMHALRGLGEEVWFNLGDVDLATHLLRTDLLRGGSALSEVTRRLATAMGVQSTVLPMSDHVVTTRLTTAEHGHVSYVEFLVRLAAVPQVVTVHYEGLEHAVPAPGVLEAIARADLVVLAPSNPVASLDPILGVHGVRAAVRDSLAHVVGVSPIVLGVPIADAGEARRAASRAALLRAVGGSADPLGVASRYADICHRFVLDTADASFAPAIRALGLEVVLARTLLHTGVAPEELLAALSLRRAPTGRAARARAGSASLRRADPRLGSRGSW
ncbi:2-phospho-L-lactate transferase CofD family protein [Mycobacterium vicinigordonae]|uniref:YvcK family protein n=1 Tax=Mycobacterium vicinigordonae TaxID=1719132 RepID=A0A7D6E1N7_9MYCO|nr:2-phospho-L-lactate transferase CofD family protein [Mycobacterium vicinigordonae]QLL06506.1 YvcK family protein [Mycobacterium vicinigordonae]